MVPERHPNPWGFQKNEIQKSVVPEQGQIDTQGLGTPGTMSKTNDTLTSRVLEE